MSVIIDKMKQEIINRSNLFEEETKGTKDEYNIYKEHIQYVYNYVCLLSKGQDVDHEVLELSALLHDIAMTDKTLDRSKHNEDGADITEQLLRDNNYPEDKIQFVKNIFSPTCGKSSMGVFSFLGWYPDTKTRKCGV